MSHQIKVTDELYNQLKEKAGARTIPALLRELLAANTIQKVTQVDLVDKLDSHPEDFIPEEDKKLLHNLGPGELPECCQRIYENPEEVDMSLACKHWKKGYVNYYGRRIWHLQNSLTGGSYFDYFNKYVGA